MAKVKKYANGGSYTVEVKGSPKPAPKEKPVTPNVGGWNIPSMQPDKK